jgi:hypothetical protein
MIPREWIISHRCSWIMVYVFCRNAQSKPHSDPRDVCTLSLLYQLPNCNLFTQHALFILWRDTTSELLTPVQFSLHSFTVLFYSHYLLYLQTIILSWEFRDSSHGDGLTEGLDGVRCWVQLGIVQLRHHGLPRFRALHAGGNTPTSCLISYYLHSGYNAPRAIRSRGGRRRSDLS